MEEQSNLEKWVPIAGFEGYYEVSDKGRVRSLDRYIRNGEKGMRLRRGRVVVFSKHNNGYDQANLWKDNKGHSFLVHRLVAAAFHQNPNNLEFVNHIDGDKHNNTVDNLEWITRQDNHKHAARIGLIPSGDSHYKRKRA